MPHAGFRQPASNHCSIVCYLSARNPLLLPPAPCYDKKIIVVQYSAIFQEPKFFLKDEAGGNLAPLKVQRGLDVETGGSHEREFDLTLVLIKTLFV